MIYAENILICIAIPLLLSLLFLSGSVRKYMAAFLLGMVMCLLSAYINGFLALATGMGERDTAVFLSPLVEELMKLLPLMFFMVLTDVREKTLTMIAIAIGTGFATYENCCYILTSGADNLFYVFIRGFAVGIMHIVSILALSIWFTLTKRLKVFSLPAVSVGVAISMIFHALYNLLVSKAGASTVTGFILPPAMSILLYFLYRHFGNKETVA